MIRLPPFTAPSNSVSTGSTRQPSTVSVTPREVVARAVQQWKGPRPYVFTKCGMRWDKNGRVSKVHSPESIRQECADSLRRLRVDVIDLYQIHWPPEDNGPALEESWQTMAALQKEGKVRWIGVSNYDASQLQRCEKIAPVTSLQPPYSLIRRQIENEILPHCERRGIGVIVYSPMASGLLTGAMTRERIAKLPEDDWRKNSPELREPRLSKNLELVERLKKSPRVTRPFQARSPSPGPCAFPPSPAQSSEHAMRNRPKKLCAPAKSS